MLPIRTRNIVLALCAAVSLLVATGFVVPQNEEEEEYIYTRKVYVAACNCYYAYVYEKGTDRLLSISKLYGTTDSLDGISYGIEENGDTSDISYNHKGQRAPLSIYRYRQKNKQIQYSVSEFVEGVAVDDWRRNYSITDISLSGDSAHIAYTLQGEGTVFRELYVKGRRVARHIDRQAPYDSLKAVYYSVTGKQLFQQCCTSCHTPGKPATGPDLRGVSKRRSEAWLRRWIACSPKMIAEGDPDAVQLYNEWYKTSMTSFPLEPVLMDKLMAYLETL